MHFTILFWIIQLENKTSSNKMWVLYEYLNSEGINKGIHDAKSYILSYLWENQMNIS